MKKFISAVLVAALFLGMSSCKDEVYFPISENTQIDDVVDIDFNPSVVHPFDGVDGEEGTGNDDDTSIDTDLGKAFIYIFPNDALSFTLTGLSQTDVTRLEILVNDRLVDTFESPLPDPLNYTVDRSLFHPGRNVMTLRYTFPNGSQVHRDYYYIVFDEEPTAGLDYDFFGMVSIGDTKADVVPSVITITCEDLDAQVDLENHKIYMVAGKVTTESVLATDSDGNYGNLWLYSMSLVAEPNPQKSNVSVRNMETSILWDNSYDDSIFRCSAERTGVKDLNWEQPFDMQHHTVKVSCKYRGYMTLEGETYYISSEDSETFSISAKHPQSRN